MRAILPILEALAGAGVDFVVVGGVAVVLQGHPRMTVDLDVALDLSEDNARRALEVLTDAGLVPRLPVDVDGFADARTREGWFHERDLRVFSLHDPDDPRREVDLFTVHPVPYPELRARARRVVVEGVEVLVASIEDLVTMKRQAGRTQDLADIEALAAIAAERRGET